ncbi:MAG: class I SAM-dependent methyltransferase [Planctomycetales bacterium]|nr:class I SAM-dependent methyltransferase [Planctomycetales bacterium]
MVEATFDKVKAEAFAGHMLGILNGGLLTLMVSVGHRTGLFDTMARLPPGTSEAIAKAAGLSERYVREWLAAMTVGKIVLHDPDSGTYRLPPEHAAAITREAGVDNLAGFSQYLSLFGGVEDEVVACFRKGGGVPYRKFPKFQALQAEESGAIFDATLIQRTLPGIPGLVEKLRSGADVLDVGCGSGHAANLMARAFPASRFTGYDFSKEGVAAGRSEARRWKLKNVRFSVKNVTALADRARYDLITAFDAIHDQAKPRKVLAGIARAVRPGGTFLMVDIAASSRVHENMDHPFGPALYGASTFHCMTVSLAQRGEGLGTMWGEQKARELLAEAGFARVEVRRIEGDFLNNYFTCSRG